jgi:hypothetical protein
MTPMAGVPGFEAMKAQQAAFMKAMTGGMAGWPSGPQSEEEDEAGPSAKDELADIRRQLADLQKQLATIGES